MNSIAIKKKPAYQEWLGLPDNVIGEILSDELHVSPRPSPKHSFSTSRILGQLNDPFNVGKGGPGGWVILFEPEIHLESNIVVPDVAGWRKERMLELPDESFFSTIPDWICEVISPSTAVLDRVKKMPLYSQKGLKYFWLVDPSLKTLEVYENLQGKWSLIQTYANEKKSKIIPFHDYEFDIQSLWG